MGGGRKTRDYSESEKTKANWELVSHGLEGVLMAEKSPVSRATGETDFLMEGVDPQKGERLPLPNRISWHESGAR